MTGEARAADSPPRSSVHIPNPTYLYVIFDGPSGHESGRFVEVEDENGQGVRVGTWEERGDGLWSLGPFLQPPVGPEPCPHCKEGWVCEAHPEKGWPHDDCPGPGKPCTQCVILGPLTPEQPASDLGAMVNVFLADCERSAHALGLARGTAARLKEIILTHRPKVAEQPATNPSAVVETILTRCNIPLPSRSTVSKVQLAASRRLAAIRDDAQLLKEALEQREGVMGEMASVLLARAVVAHDYLEKEGGVEHKPPFLKCDHPACVDARALVNQYNKATHQPREASSTEGEQ